VIQLDKATARANMEAEVEAASQKQEVYAWTGNYSWENWNDFVSYIRDGLGNQTNELISDREIIAEARKHLIRVGREAKRMEEFQKREPRADNSRITVDLTSKKKPARKPAKKKAAKKKAPKKKANSQTKPRSSPLNNYVRREFGSSAFTKQGQIKVDVLRKLSKNPPSKKTGNRAKRALRRR
jgi:hypothetical protein